MAEIVEKGFSYVHVSHNEAAYLQNEGFEELCHLHSLVRLNIPDIEEPVFQRIMDRFRIVGKLTVRDLPVRLGIKDATLALIDGAKFWEIGSPAFSSRNDSQTPLQFHQIIRGYDIHFQAFLNNDQTINLNTLITHSPKRGNPYYTVELMKGNRCIESLKGIFGEITHLSWIPVDEYLLRITSKQVTIFHSSLRVEHTL
ncbi:MAG: hypothetical protein JW795_13925 [Chitinivibrionales bacterium]|nr:hypothetical protein [Chitinivibrionales bacterium]